MVLLSAAVAVVFSDPSVTINKEQSLNLFKKSKTIKFEILSPYTCTAFASTWFLLTIEECKLQTYTHTHTQTDYCMPSAHVHQGIIITSKISSRNQKHV